MNIAKTPDDNKDWENINIYLFSNGQEQSPPRKYHLKSDELKSWEDTLSYLACSQFGSETLEIELYTLEGEKINTPLELISSSAYVAIKSKEEFIQAGYSKYLIKASRSWERRQDKQGSEKLFTNETQNTILPTSINNNVENTTKNNDSKRKESDVSNNETVRRTSQNNNAKKSLQKNKTANDNKLNGSQQKFKRKDVSYLRCFKGSPRKPSVALKNIKSSVPGMDLNDAFPTKISTNNDKLNKSNIEPEGKNIHNHNSDRKKPGVNPKLTNIDTKLSPTKEITHTPETKPKLNETNGDKAKLNDKCEEKSRKLSNNKENDIIDLKLPHQSLPPKEHTDQGITTDRGFIIKLKLNLETRGNNVIISKVEEETLQDDGNRNNEEEEIMPSNFSITREFFSNHGNPKIIIVNCACDDDDSNSKIIQLSDKIDGINYKKPSIELTEDKERTLKQYHLCACDPKDYQEFKGVQTSNDEEGLKNKTKGLQVSLSPEPISYKPLNGRSNGGKMTEPILSPNCEKSDKTIQSNSTPRSSLVQGSVQKNEAICTCESSQTEWYDVVIEARRERDGHYVLHLPPLHYLIDNNLY